MTAASSATLPAGGSDFAAAGTASSSGSARLRRRNAKPRISAAAATPTAITAVRSNGAAGALGCAAAGLAGAAATGGAEAGTDDAEALEAGSAPLAADATLAGAAFDGAAAGFALGAALSGAGLPMPCNCNSISTRFFSASNCCRLDGRACGAFASGAEAARGVTGTALPGASSAASAALDPTGGAVWIEPLQECALAGSPRLPPLACWAAPGCVAGAAVAAEPPWASAAEVGATAAAADTPVTAADETPAGCAGNDASTCDAPEADEAPATGAAPVAAVAAVAGCGIEPPAAGAAAAGLGCAPETLPADDAPGVAELPACGANAPVTAVAALPACAGAAPAGAEAPEAPDTVDVAIGDATADPLASSGGTVSVAPTFSRLGSCFMKACGFAANSARPARASTPGSRDWVAATAISLSD
nr:hypothetical protein [Burkholderia gladioli]